MSETLREWLLKIAKAVEEWNTMPKDDAEVAISVSSPSGAVKYIVSKHIPAAVAAQLIRQAAASLKEEKR